MHYFCYNLKSFYLHCLLYVHVCLYTVRRFNLSIVFSSSPINLIIMTLLPENFIPRYGP